MTQTKNDFQLKIWGARGSRPVMGQEFAEFGGNTSCFEVSCGNTTLIFDTGTGFNAFSADYLKRPGDDKQLYIFNSHSHFDHLTGIEQAGVMFNPKIKKTFFGGSYCYRDGGFEELDTPEDLYRKTFREPLSPNLAELHINLGLKFHHLQPCDKVAIGTREDQIIIRTYPLPHSDRIALGFRIDYKGKSLAILTDLSADTDEGGYFQSRIADIPTFVQGVNLLLADSHFTLDNYKKAPFLKTFGHATPESILALALDANIPRVLFSHHNPESNDSDMNQKQETYRFLGQSLGIEADFAREKSQHAITPAPSYRTLVTSPKQRLALA